MPMNKIYDEFGRIKPHPNLDTSGINYKELSESSNEVKKYALKRIAYLRSLYDEYMRLHQEYLKLKAEYEKYVALNNVLQLENLKQKAKRFVLLNPMLQDKDHATAEELFGEMAKNIAKIEEEFSKYCLEYMEYKDKYLKEAMGNNVRTLSHTKALAQNFFYNFELDDFKKHRLLDTKHIGKEKKHTKLFNCAFSAAFYPTEVRHAGTTTMVVGWGALEFCRAFNWNQAIYHQMGMFAHQWLMSNMNGFLKVWLNSDRARKYGTPDTSYPFTEEDFKGMFGDAKFPRTLFNIQLGNSYYDVDFTLFYHPIDTGAVGTPHFGIISVEDVINDDNVYKHPILTYVKPIQHFGPDCRNNHDRNYMWWWTHFGVKLSFDYDIYRQTKRQEIQQSIIDKALESRESIEYATEAVRQAQRDYDYKKAINQITDLRNARRSAKRWLLSSPYMNFTNFTPANFKELDLPTMQELDNMVADTEKKIDSALVSLEATQKHNNIVGLLNARVGALALLHNKEIVGEREFIDYTNKELFEIFHALNRYKAQYEGAIMKVNINHFLNAKAEVKQFMHFYPMWSKWFYIEPKPIVPTPPAPEPEVETPQEPEVETPQEPEVELPPVIEEVVPPVKEPETQQVEETTDNANEPNFTDEELEVVLCNRARYEDLKEFFVEWARLNGRNDEAQAKDALYKEMRQSITALQQNDIAKNFRNMGLDRLKEAIKFIGRMSNLLSGGVGSGMFKWWEEVPTITAMDEYNRENADKLNSILDKHFILPMNSKEDFLYNYYLTSQSDRGIGGYSGMLQIMEMYFACTYEDSMWFLDNLTSVSLGKIEKYQMLSNIANNPPYTTLSDETSKKEFASFYLSQILMGSKMGGDITITREKMLEEIEG